MLLNKPKRQSLTLFSEFQFFIGSLRKRGKQFWQPCWKIFANLPKTFAQDTKNDLFIFPTRNVFPQVCPLDTYNVVFTNLWKFFQEKVELVLLKNRFSFRKTDVARFFLWTRKKQFCETLKTKLTNSEIFSLLVLKHEQSRKLSKNLCPKNCSFGETSGTVNNPEKIVFARRQKNISYSQKYRKKLHRSKKLLRCFLWTRKIKCPKLYRKLLPKEGNNFAQQTKTWTLKSFH